MTVAELAREFATKTEERGQGNIIVKRHVENIKGHLNNYIARDIFARDPRGRRDFPAFEKSLVALKLAEVDSPRAVRFADDLAATGLRHTTVRAVIVTAHSMWDYARLRNYVQSNPFRGLKIEKPRDAKNQKVIPPSPAQVQALADAAPEPLRTMILFTAYTGLRSGEIRALRQSNLDLEDAKVRVTHSIDADYDETERHPKSEAAIRTIELSDDAVALIHAHRDRRRGWSAGDLLFPGEDGKHLPNRYLRDALLELEGRFALPPPDVPGRIGVDRVGWHTLRHFEISSWIHVGLNLKAIQTFAGHADIRITMDRYGHLFPSEDYRAKMNKAAALIR